MPSRRISIFRKSPNRKMTFPPPIIVQLLSRSSSSTNHCTAIIVSSFNFDFHKRRAIHLDTRYENQTFDIVVFDLVLHNVIVTYVFRRNCNDMLPCFPFLDVKKKKNCRVDASKKSNWGIQSLFCISRFFFEWMNVGMYSSRLELELNLTN